MPPRNLHVILLASLVSAFCFVTADRVRRVLVIGDALDLIERHYVDPVDREKLVDSAMAGLTSGLDPYTEFIPESLYSAFNDSFLQEFAGVGILVEQPRSGEPVRVITPLVGSPALAAGLMPGDEIVGVEGDDVSELDIREVTDRLRGPIGSDVLVMVRRMIGDVAERIEIRLRRQTILVESVVGDHREQNDRWVYRLRNYPRIAYLRITTFGEKTAGEIRQVLADLKGDYDSLILDVRGNSGGLLHSAVEICDDFLDEGRIVSIRKRGGELESEFEASPGVAIPADLPVVVLIDGNSASASEIVAACLQDHGRATVIGSRSFGKGTVQSVLLLESGRSALKLTTARYYRPSGRNIHRLTGFGDDDEWGVTPDEGMVVAMSDEMRQALVRKWQRSSYPVSNQPDPEPSEPIADEPPASEPGSDATELTDLDKKTPAASSKDPSGRMFDPQLRRAIDFLLGSDSDSVNGSAASEAENAATAPRTE